MFERARIGGCIYNLADSLTREGSPVDRRVRVLFDPFMDAAVKDMKRHRLKGDQAALAMIVNLMNTFQKNGVLKKLFDDQYDLFISLVRLYQGAYLLMCDQPEHFERANLLFDQEVFASLDRAP